MWLFIAVISAVVFGLAGFGMKVGQMRGVPTSMVLIGLYLSGTLGFLFTWLGGGAAAGILILLAGLVIGLGSAGGNFAFMRALETGPASLASPIVNMNVVLVILLSVLVYGETLGWVKAAGVFCIVVAIILIALRPSGAGGARGSLHWLALVLLSTLLFAVRNGGLKVTQEMGLDNSAVLFFSYLFPLIYFIFRHWGELIAITPEKRLPTLGWGLASGVGSFGGLQLYAYALSQGPASVISPVFSLYGLVIVLLSVWIYKERLTALQSLAVALTFAGLVLVRF
ncbi:EamA family transporter [Heliobacterium undosum]|uniref:EamA family transporter n=1 Tax=Heliomicrobium undosum TaxID=121734 RepID=A0A845L212_9FIRM|nr:DMT family transporter [Heliomicrobium undosum]MZP28854.1 EamA family transporter [Heliomicrobium undosum]